MRSGRVRCSLELRREEKTKDPPGRSLHPAGPRRPALGAGRVALEWRQRLDLRFGVRQRPRDVDVDQRTAGLAAHLADDRDVEAVAAQERFEPQVEVRLWIERAPTLEAQGVPRELDRIQAPKPV